MIVRYIVPEDGDDFSHPNVFEFFPKNNPMLTEFKKAFPFPGNYHFRFLTVIDSVNSHVWLDVVNDNIELPLLNGGLFVKASRLCPLLEETHHTSVSSTEKEIETTTTTTQREEDLLDLQSMMLYR